MKSFKSILCASLLTLAMSAATFAGNITGKAGNITSTAIAGNITGRAGNITGLVEYVISIVLIP